jgi:DNA (cytosine-5)-methyltransferase 1
LFSGIGAFEKALTNLNIPFNLINFCEFDKYASKAFSLIHNIPESRNLGDITLIDEKSIKLPVDLITYGFPCQDISIAGGQQGLFNEDGTTTRSGLFFDALRIITHTHPKVAIAENVKNLTCKKFAKQFQIVLQSLDEAGYNNYFKILDAKDYRIPQSRERVFIVSIRKDIDTEIFNFPEPLEPKLRLIDMLEESVDAKYFLSDKEITYMNREVKGGRSHWDFKHHSEITDQYCRCLTANLMKGVPYNVLRIGSVDLNGHDLCKRIYNPYGCSPTIPTGQSGNTIPKIPVDDVARKFTPKECFRLMGFEDSDWQVLVENRISDSQLYKMAGNSIVVDVAEELLCMIFDSDNEIYV